MLNSVGLYPSPSRPGIQHQPVPYKIISLGAAESHIPKTENTE